MSTSIRAKENEVIHSLRKITTDEIMMSVKRGRQSISFTSSVIAIKYRELNYEGEQPSLPQS